MVTTDVRYLVPETLEEAISLLSKYAGQAKLIAGGQSLNILIKQELIEPKYLISLKRLSGLSFIEADAQGLRIGALTTHRAIETSAVIRSRFGILAEMEANVATLQIRNVGTIGGNLCHAEPAGDPAPVLIALNAKLKIVGLKGERSVATEDFATDYFETILAPDEILTEIQVPVPAKSSGVALFRTARLAIDLGKVTGAVMIRVEDGVCKGARIALGGVAPVPVRAKKAEIVVIGSQLDDQTIDQATTTVCDEIQPIDDLRASKEYRVEVSRRLLRMAIRTAWERATAKVGD